MHHGGDRGFGDNLAASTWTLDARYKIKAVHLKDQPCRGIGQCARWIEIDLPRKWFGYHQHRFAYRTLAAPRL